MALLGTLTTSVSALDSFTTGLDTIGNNIANINSTAFKGANVSFADTFSGLGTQVSGVNTNFAQGSLTSTGTVTNLGISGNGYFIVKDPASGATYATRDGQFTFDSSGYLVNQLGYRVQGLTGGSSGTAPGTLGDIQRGNASQRHDPPGRDHQHDRQRGGSLLGRQPGHDQPGAPAGLRQSGRAHLPGQQSLRQPGRRRPADLEPGRLQRPRPIRPRHRAVGHPRAVQRGSGPRNFPP